MKPFGLRDLEGKKGGKKKKKPRPQGRRRFGTMRDIIDSDEEEEEEEEEEEGEEEEEEEEILPERRPAHVIQQERQAGQLGMTPRLFTPLFGTETEVLVKDDPVIDVLQQSDFPTIDVYLDNMDDPKYNKVFSRNLFRLLRNLPKHMSQKDARAFFQKVVVEFIYRGYSDTFLHDGFRLLDIALHYTAFRHFMIRKLTRAIRNREKSVNERVLILARELAFSDGEAGFKLFGVIIAYEEERRPTRRTRGRRINLREVWTFGVSETRKSARLPHLHDDDDDDDDEHQLDVLRKESALFQDMQKRKRMERLIGDTVDSRRLIEEDLRLGGIRRANQRIEDRNQQIRSLIRRGMIKSEDDDDEDEDEDEGDDEGEGDRSMIGTTSDDEILSAEDVQFLRERRKRLEAQKRLPRQTRERREKLEDFKRRDRIRRQAEKRARREIREKAANDRLTGKKRPRKEDEDEDEPPGKKRKQSPPDMQGRTFFSRLKQTPLTRFTHLIEEGWWRHNRPLRIRFTKEGLQRVHYV